MMTEEELKLIEDRAAAAIPGPWAWRISLKGKTVHLEAQISGLEFVMGFNRYGMSSAKPMVQKDGIMVGADELTQIIPRREHHADWCRAISHPDADFIAHARQDVPALVAEVRRLKAELMKASESTSKAGEVR
jgi:hypothetical protein